MQLIQCQILTLTNIFSEQQTIKLFFNNIE